MDATTLAVRDMYEQYPYPASEPTLRVAADVRLLMSYVARTRPEGRPVRALDAGCGRGAGLLGYASLQPDVHFTGIDLNRVALAELSQSVKNRRLANVTLQEVDLMSLEGLEVPQGGFDVIYSSGVLHHLTDPEAGLRKLRQVLAPHGVIVLMVYAKYGRHALNLLRECADLLLPDSLPLSARIAPARDLARFMNTTTLENTPWNTTAEEGDVEFVDRALNVNETSYDIQQLFRLLDATATRLIRFVEPDDWSVSKRLPEGQLRELAQRLPEMQQYQLIERLFYRTNLQLIIARDDNVARPPLSGDVLLRSPLCLNPDVRFLTETRNHRGNQRIESIKYALRSNAPVVIPNSPFAQAVLILKDQTKPFIGHALVQILGEEGIPSPQAQALVCELVEKEILFSPHPADA